MKLNILDIPEEGLILYLQVLDQDLADTPLDGLASLTSPIKLRLEVRRQGDRVFIDGPVDAELMQACSRCLKEFACRIEASHSGSYLITESKEGGGERELTGAELIETPLEGDEIDLKGAVIEQIALELPIKPLCRDDCKGLCPRCGTDLNVESCACVAEKEVDPRLARLKDFKGKK